MNSYHWFCMVFTEHEYDISFILKAFHEKVFMFMPYF